MPRLFLRMLTPIEMASALMWMTTAGIGKVVAGLSHVRASITRANSARPSLGTTADSHYPCSDGRSSPIISPDRHEAGSVVPSLLGPRLAAYISRTATEHVGAASPSVRAAHQQPPAWPRLLAPVGARRRPPTSRRPLASLRPPPAAVGAPHIGTPARRLAGVHGVGGAAAAVPARRRTLVAPRTVRHTVRPTASIVPTQVSNGTHQVFDEGVRQAADHRYGARHTARVQANKSHERLE